MTCDCREMRLYHHSVSVFKLPFCHFLSFSFKSQLFQYKVNFSSNEVNHFRKTVNFTSEEGQQKQYRKTLALKSSKKESTIFRKRHIVVAIIALTVLKGISIRIFTLLNNQFIGYLLIRDTQ